MASTVPLTAIRPVRRVHPMPRARRAPREQPNGLVSAAFVFFVSSLPFELALLVVGGNVSISRLLGYGLFAFALLQPKVCFRRLPREAWWFGAYVVVFSVLSLFQAPQFLPANLSKAFRMVQLLAVLWMGYNLLQFKRVAKWCLLGFGSACVAVACLLAAGIGVSDYRDVAGRETALGLGPNTIAAVVALGAVTLVGLAYGRANSRWTNKVAAWGAIMVVAVAITRTGSRGALVAVFGGLATLLTSYGSSRTRLRNAMILIGALIVCAAVTLTSATASSRWHKTISEGNMAGRQTIYRTAFTMFLQKPILGWGPLTNYYELGGRLHMKRGTRDTHNVFLWLLTEVGLVGSVPFFIGLAMCVRSAWRGRRGSQGLLPLALIITAMTVSLVGTYYELKWFWVILAYALAAGAGVRVPPVRRRAAVPVPPGARTALPRSRGMVAGRLR